MSLLVERGEIVGLIGPNGSGKTTLLNVINGLERADDGTIALDDRRIERSAGARRSPAPASAAPSRRWRLPATPSRPTWRARWRRVRPSCCSTSRRPASATASGGRCRRLLASLRDAGRGVLIVDHDIELLSRVCDRLVCLDRGRVIASGSPAEVRADPRVRASFLGLDGDRGMSAVLEIGDVSVEAGEIVALLGGNGAGKTTLLETVLGFHPGRVVLFGRDASALAVEQRVGLGVGYVPEGRRVFAGLTVRENLEAASSLPAGQRRQRVEEMLALFPMLGERPEARAWLLSGGQQQMLALARALMDRPRLLLLDEPTLGLAPVVVADLLRRLSAMTADGTAILLAEQRAALALGVARRGVVLSRGQVVRRGSAAELAADPTLADLMAGA